MVQLQYDAGVEGDWSQPMLEMRLSRGRRNFLAELVRADQLFSQSCVREAEDESSTVGVASSPGIPVNISVTGRYLAVVGEFRKHSVDGLPLRGDYPNLHSSFLKGEYLGSKHRRVRYSKELLDAFRWLISGDDEEPGPIRGPVNVS